MGANVSVRQKERERRIKHQDSTTKKLYVSVNIAMCITREHTLSPNKRVWWNPKNNDSSNNNVETKCRNKCETNYALAVSPPSFSISPKCAQFSILKFQCGEMCCPLLNYDDEWFFFWNFEGLSTLIIAKYTTAQRIDSRWAEKTFKRF